MTVIQGSNDPFMLAVALEEAQDAAYLDVNLNALDLAVLYSGRLADATLTAPPGSPATKKGFYLVNSLATGLWTGHEGQLTYWDGIEWRYIGKGTGNDFPESDSSSTFVAQEVISNNLFLCEPGIGATKLTRFHESSHHGTVNATTTVYVFTHPETPYNVKVTAVDFMASTTTTSDATNHWTINVQELAGGLDIASTDLDTNGNDLTADTWLTALSVNQNNDPVVTGLECTLTKLAAADDLTRLVIRVTYEWTA